jgi:hypothetical protein
MTSTGRKRPAIRTPFELDALLQRTVTQFGSGKNEHLPDPRAVDLHKINGHKLGWFCRGTTRRAPAADPSRLVDELGRNSAPQHQR